MRGVHETPCTTICTVCGSRPSERIGPCYPMLMDDDGCTMWWFICWFWLVLSAMPMDLTIGVLWMGGSGPAYPNKNSGLKVDWRFCFREGAMHSRCISRITMLWGKHAKKDVMCQSKSRRLITGHLRSQVSRCFKMSRDLCLERPKDSAFPWRYGTQAHMEWTVNVWLPKYYRQNLDTDPQPGHVAIQNQIIGGSRLHKEYWQTGQMGRKRPSRGGDGWLKKWKGWPMCENVWKRSLKTTSQGRKVLSRKRPGPCVVSPEQARLYNSYTAQCDRNGGFTEEDIVLPYHLQKSRLLDQL